ncbi:MAG: biopolymer transporter ExbD [Alistipes sp.]|nr:biopolymer transporter ExbD [Alistipes sp.]MCD8172540.1 biopolymer transporter ExbD [Alistipes sp.]
MASKRKVQEVNAGSMADIAFLLLIFFLVATTMNVDTGLQRVLPPIAENPDTEVDIKQRNIMLVFVNRFNQINAGGEVIDITQLKDKAKDFILNVYDDENLPEKEMQEIEGYGQYPVSQGVISLQNDRGTSYDTYIQVQNELTRAVNEIRDEVSMAKWGKKFLDLPEDQRQIITKAVPSKISEAEPRNIEGGR